MGKDLRVGTVVRGRQRIKEQSPEEIHRAIECLRRQPLNLVRIEAKHLGGVFILWWEHGCEYGRILRTMSHERYVCVVGIISALRRGESPEIAIAPLIAKKAAIFKPTIRRKPAQMERRQQYLAETGRL